MLEGLGPTTSSFPPLDMLDENTDDDCDDAADEHSQEDAGALELPAPHQVHQAKVCVALGVPDDVFKH